MASSNSESNPALHATRKKRAGAGGGEAAIGDRLAQARESTLPNAIATASQLDLIHRCALRYLREWGLVK